MAELKVLVYEVTDVRPHPNADRLDIDKDFVMFFD